MSEPVCWIDDIDYRHANPMLRSIYDQVSGANGQLDNLYRAFSLSPQTIVPADTLYKAAMHHSNNVLPKVFSELIGTYVAILSGCEYARAHHGHNFIALSDDAETAKYILKTLAAASENDGQSGNHSSADNEIRDTACTAKEAAALRYVRKLCLLPQSIVKDDISALHSAGWSNTEISEIAQVVAMFSYFVRVINGVGIRLGDEKPGLY